MQYEEKMEYLRGYQKEQRKQLLLELELEELRGEAERITPLLTGIPGSGLDTQRLPKAVERILETKEELQAQIFHCQTARKQIKATISEIKDEQRQEVLSRRYILGQRWEEISGDMQLDYRWTLRIHKKTVEQLTIESH